MTQYRSDESIEEVDLVLIRLKGSFRLYNAIVYSMTIASTTRDATLAQ